MSAVRTTLSRIGPRRLGLRVLGVLALAAALGRSGPQAETKALPPARNPERLHLLADAAKVVGWVGGTHDHAGAAVTVTAGGVSESVTVQPGNTFSWPYKVRAATTATFALGGLRQTIRLAPPEDVPPCAFFVVDRGVYRPGQTLHFAAYLRQLDARGEFVPRPERLVEVRLTSEAKNITAARLKLPADEQGRVVGEYTFTDSDPLDTYRLTAPLYKGEARVTLAEYRKPRNHLNILGEREGARMRLRFQARDYLDRPLKGARVQFAAEVVREAVRPEPGPLDGNEFAYAEKDQPPLLRPLDLTAEERQLLTADDGWGAITGLSVGRTRRTVVSQGDKLSLDDRGEGVTDVPLRRDWLRPGHSLVVQGVMTDGNGREVRLTKTIPLTGGEVALRLSLPRTTFRVNEPIRVTAHTREEADPGEAPTLVAMLLSPTPVSVPNPLDDDQPEVPLPLADWGNVRRDLATAVVFKGDTATLRLREPGAYRLTALWPRRDGPPLRQEVGCTVVADDQPTLSLRLGRDRYQAGDTLTGMVRSKFADARVLLVLRDGVGLRLWRPLRLAGGEAEVKVALPEDLHYGCAVEVQYADDDGPPFVASRLVHVVPAGKMLTVKSDIKPVLQPGEQAVLDVEVNRKEPVDLIVSVYDRSLLQIAPDRSPDPRNFYLADDRIAHSQARAVLLRRLGDVTLDALLKRADRWLKEHPRQQATSEGLALRSVVHNANGVNLQYLTTSNVAALLRLAGIKARAVDVVDDNFWSLPEPSERKKLLFGKWLGEKMDANDGPRGGAPIEGRRMLAALIDETFLLCAYQPEINPQPWGIQWDNVIVGFRGMGMGGLGGIGGIAGLGGGGFNRAAPGGGFQGQGNLGMGGIVGVGGLNNNFQGGNLGLAALGAPPYQPPASFGLSIRRNFADSAYWNARLRTGADGEARVAFKVPDSLTDWQVVVTAISRDMHVGRHEATFRTARPLMVQPILPRFFTEGDRVRVSANVHNLGDAPQPARVRLRADKGTVLDGAEKTVLIEPHGSGTVSWDFRAGGAGTVELLMSAEAPAGKDASLKKLAVVRAGVEHVVTASGFCKGGASLELPAGVDPARAVLEVRFAPTVAADLLDTLPYLVEYPYGCVEQTMSRFLPAIKVAQVLKQLQLKNPELERKLPGYVAAGIKRLLELQHADGGWGWWTNDATHEFMTAYALYGLIEAEKAGYRIPNPDAIERGLKCLDKFIENQSTKVSDRVWCLYVWGQYAPMLQRWWDHLWGWRKDGSLSDYALALALELAVRHKKSDLAAALAGDLRKRARRDGDEVHWRTGGFAHWGDDRFEVTAAALKALVAFDKDDPLIPGVLAFFAATKRGDRWNSTKDTALIIEAMCDYLARRQVDPHSRPHVALRCNDGPEQKATFAGPAESCRLVVPSDRLRPAANRLTFPDASDGMMFRATLRYHAAGRDLPAEAHGIEVRRHWWLLDDEGRRTRELKNGEEVPCGAFLECSVEARPADERTMDYVLVESPRPAGCEVLPDDDPRFARRNRNDSCLLREERDRLVAFHHDITRDDFVDSYLLHAELPGEFLVPPAHVEMMYRTERRGHSGTFTLRVASP